jgi:hypothetical protein
MSIETQPQTAPASASPNPASPANSAAVTRCCEAWDRVYRTQLQKGEMDFLAAKVAAKAFRNSMPPLIGRENIRDFIACVAQGVLLEAIEVQQSNRLLYAAQIALTSLRSQPSPSKNAA